MSRRIRNAACAILALSALLLAGCGQKAIKPTPMPAVVHEVITRYAVIPPQYTRPLTKPERASNRVKDVVQAYNLRGETIDTCNWRLSTIDALSGQVVAPAAPSSAAQPP